MIDDLWAIDGRVLDELVRQIEIEGQDFGDCTAAFAKAGVDPAAGDRSVERLVRNGMLGGNPPRAATGLSVTLPSAGSASAALGPARISSAPG